MRPAGVWSVSDDFDLDALAKFFGQLANGPREIIGDTDQGCGAQLQDASLKFRNTPINSIESIGHFGIL